MSAEALPGPRPGIRIEDLDSVPHLGGLYARGLRRSVAAHLPSRSTPVELPRVAYRTRGVQAEAGHLTAYEHLVGEPAADTLPAGFVHVLAFPVATALMVRTDFPLPLLGMVHVANTVSVCAPLNLSDELEVTAWAQHLRPHRRGTQVDLVTEVSTAGSLAWQGVSTYLARHPVSADATSGSVSTGSTDEAEPTGSTERVPDLVWSLTADVGRRYAALSGDRNPIHTSALGAKVFGFRRAIAHGMYTAARVLADVGPRRGDTYDWTVEFAKPVLLPGRVAVGITDPDRTRDSFGYEGWSPGSRRTHFTGTVTPR
ncbi:MAG: MaoC/PaaZ C-terminal domain-containing protein [Cellulomonadaceae bacterium]